MFLEEVEPEHVGLAVGAGGAEADRAEDAGEEGDVVVHRLALGEFALLEELGNHVKTEDVGLALLEGRGSFLEGVADAASVVEGVLDAETVGDFVEHGVAEEGVEGDVLALVGGNEQVGDGDEDLVVLGPHGVLELEATGAFLKLDRFVVGQVDGDGFGPGVAVAGVVDDVVGVQVGVGAGGFLLVGVGDRETALETGQQGGVFREALAPVLVLDEDVGLEGGLAAEECVLVGFDRTDDDVEGVVLHVHPGHVAGTVLIGQQGGGTKVEIPAQFLVLGEPGGQFELHGRGAGLIDEIVAVRGGGEVTVLIAEDHRILAVEGGRLLGMLLEVLGEFGLGHIRRVEAGATRLGADAGDKRFVTLQAVPGAVVDLGEAAHVGIGDALQQGLLVTVGLQPEGVVHFLRRVDEQREHLAFGMGQGGEVGRQSDDGVLVDAIGHGQGLRVGGVLLGGDPGGIV